MYRSPCVYVVVQQVEDVHDNPERHSLLSLPEQFIVPGKGVTRHVRGSSSRGVASLGVVARLGSIGGECFWGI